MICRTGGRPAPEHAGLRYLTRGSLRRPKSACALRRPTLPVTDSGKRRAASATPRAARQMGPGTAEEVRARPRLLWADGIRGNDYRPHTRKKLQAGD